MSNIKIVRIATGEELICDVKEQDGGYNLTDVAILIPTEANQLGLAPFMAYSDASGGFNINPSFIMFMVDPVEQLKNQYQQMFGKVMTPDKKIIL
jgi:hypothetical protein